MSPDPHHPKIAAIQLNGRPDWPANRQLVERLVREAAAQGALVAVLPENLYAMPATEAAWRALAIGSDDEAIGWLGNLARRAGVWLVAGTLPIRSDDPAEKRVWARSLVFDDTGRIRAHYDKIHLFDVDLPDRAESYRESELFLRGESPVVVDTPAGPMGMSVCFDLRFPELYRALADAGARWICLPAAFTEMTGRAHWHALIRARAIENSVDMVAAAQVGRHADGRRTYGHSLIVDAWGEVLADAGTTADSFVCAGLDRGRQEEIRRRFPVLELRRLPSAHPKRAPD